MWICIASTVLGLVSVSSLSVLFVNWYSRRCIKDSLVLVQSKLDEFESIAKTYTEHGTPIELQSVIENLEGVMEELQYLQDNNSEDLQASSLKEE